MSDSAYKVIATLQELVREKDAALERLRAELESLRQRLEYGQLLEPAIQQTSTDNSSSSDTCASVVTLRKIVD